MATESTTQERQGNPFAQAARSKKVVSLISVIDRQARAGKLDPLSRAFAFELPTMTPQWWRCAALAAAIHAPSETTVREVIAFFRARAANPQALPEQAGA